MMMKRFFGICTCFVACLAGFSSVSVAQSNPWDGSWKMDRSSIKFDGPTMTLSADSEGYTVTREGTASPKVICDGKAHETPNGMLTCAKAGTGYELAIAKDGKTIQKVSASISADGKKRTVKATSFPPDEKPFTITSTYVRQSGGPGMSGVWKEVDFVSSRDTGVMKIKVTGDSISFAETDSPTVVCKLDGTPTKREDVAGAVSIKKVDAHTLKVTYSSLDGKARRENTFVLSADGKS